MASGTEPREPMKILVFAPEHEAETARLYADSCVVHTDRPVFLPDELHPLTSRAGIAVRIARQGKSVQARFAPRYWDAASVAFVTTPATGSNDPLRRCFDGAVACGEWVPMADAASQQSLHGEATDGIRTWALTGGEDAFSAVNQAIARASEHMTLKTGDLVLMVGGELVTAQRGMTLGGLLNGREVLTIRLK